MKTITIMNYKGGVGKTTTAINLAYGLSEQGYNTLIIDCDPQGNTSQFFGKYDETKKSITGVFAGEYILKRAIRRTKYKKLDIVQATKKLELVDIFSPVELKYSIEKLEGRYDFVICDCHPTFEAYTQCALIAADLTIVPTSLDQNSLNGLVLFDDHFQEVLDYNPDSEYKVLVTMFKRTKSDAQGLEELVGKHLYPTFKSVIRNSTKADEMARKKRPLRKFARVHGITNDYFDLTEEILEEVQR